MNILRDEFMQDVLYYSKLENISKSLYKNKQVGSILINTDGRRLDYIKTNSIDAIVSDHPWDDKKAHEGTNQKNLVEGYKDVTFNYTEKDIREKYRVLKQGSYCVEILPQLSITNITWMIKILSLFIENGFEFQASVDWVKAKSCKVKIKDSNSIEVVESNYAINEFLNKDVDIYKDNYRYFNGEVHDIIEDDVYEVIRSFKQCQGKKIKDGDTIYFFTKGKARSLKPDYSKIKKLLHSFAGEKRYMDLYKEVFIDSITYFNDNKFANEIINTNWKNKTNISSKDKRYEIFKEKLKIERNIYELKHEYMMSGTDILPARFIVPQINPYEKIHDSEKPIELYKEIVKFITRKGEVVLDQFSGSGNLGKACNNLERNSILIEIKEDIYRKCNENFISN